MGQKESKPKAPPKAAAPKQPAPKGPRRRDGEPSPPRAELSPLPSVEIAPPPADPAEEAAALTALRKAEQQLAAATAEVGHVGSGDDALGDDDLEPLPDGDAVALTAGDHDDPDLLAALHGVEASLGLDDGDDADAGADGDPLAALTAGLEADGHRVVEAWTAGNTDLAKSVLKQALRHEAELAGLGEDVAGKARAPCDAALASVKQRALAHHKGGDKAAALEVLRSGKVLKEVMTSCGLELPT